MEKSSQRNMRSFEGAMIGDKYRLDQYLAEGGFGAVYKATQFAYGVELRQVAVKVSKSTLSASQTREMFADALVVARIAERGPDIQIRQHFITLYDAGYCPDDSPLAGHPFLAMEHIDGGSFSDVLRAGPLPLTDAIQYFDQMLRAVAYMHGGQRTAGEETRAVIHRDLKPNNFLVWRRPGGPPVLKITDFGLAVELDSMLEHADAGGTVSYLAPESLQKGICTTQSDVYALALIFYEMLIGRNPFAEVGSYMITGSLDSAEMRNLHLSARRHEDFRELEQDVELKLRPDLCRVIRSALAADTASRPYASAIALQNAWEAAKTSFRPAVQEQAWDIVKRKTNEAVQWFAAGETDRAEGLLREAMRINQDRRRVPDPMVVGDAYYELVKILLRKGNIDEAGRFALEGYQRRKCKSTTQAMAEYYRATKSPLGLRFQQEAEKCES